MKARKWTASLYFLVPYFFYYLCRYNYPVALPLLKDEFALSTSQIGLIATVLTLGYSLGQLINGVLVDRKGPRLMMTIGLLGTMAANLAMGGSNLYTLLVVAWLVNGYVQAMGYPSTLKYIVNWFKAGERGKQVGYSDALCSVASILVLPLCGFLAGRWGWRYVFIVPGILAGLASVVSYAIGKDRPAGTEVPPTNLSYLKDASRRYRVALGNWRLVLANCSYGLSQFVRYGMMTWIPMYFFQVSGDSIFKAATKGSLFQVGGVVGSLFLGWASDLKLFRNRRSLLVAVCMTIAAVAGFSLGVVPAGIWTVVTLFACGAMIEAVEVPYFLIPNDILGDDMMATSGGCMNAFGKLFASFQGVGLAFIIDRLGFGAAFGTSGIIALIGALLVIPSAFAKRKA